MIYNANVLVKQLLNNAITVEQTMQDAHLSFQQRAAEMGRLGIWHK
jgi:hypothetical protein